MLAAGQLRHHPAVARVRGDLRSHHRGERARPALDNSRSRLVAGGFDAEDEAARAHLFSLAGSRLGVRRIALKEAMLPATRQFDAALRIIAALRAAGHEAYLAGGCVRDLLLGREPKDYDVATSATPDIVLECFPRTFAVGAHFGVVLVATCGGADAAGAAEDGVGEARYGSQRSPLSAPMARTPMAAIPTLCATRPAPKRTCAAATSPSMGCCWTPARRA